MFARIGVVVSLLLTGLLAATQSVWAADYVPSTASSVAPTSMTATATTTTTSTVTQGLSYTGAGFNVGATVAIAVAVLVAGALLCVFGARLARSGKH